MPSPSPGFPIPSWLKWFLGAVTTLPLISPPFTSSIALTLSLGPNGILLKFFGIENFNFYGFWGTWMSETLTYFPVSFLTLAAVLSAIDPNLEDAGLSLGASPGRVFRTVTFPLSTPRHRQLGPPALRELPGGFCHAPCAGGPQLSRAPHPGVPPDHRAV
jgi:ABC-type Fe3+ transport system, permease component